jgi:iron complex transport system substrate-binding protein
MRENPAPLGEGEIELIFWSGTDKPTSVQFNEYLEPHPLGYAEWIRVVGLLTQRQALADFFFAVQKQKYLSVRSLVTDLEYRPLVLLNSVYDGTWPVPGDDSWWGQFLRDAGAQYVFSNLRGTSVSLPVSEVLASAANADVWLNPKAFSCQELEQKIPGANKIKAWRSGKVYARPKVSSGGDDWYESGLANPEKALHELVSILHPNRLQQKYNRWFLPLEDGH